MGFLSTPESDNVYMKYYSYFLKIEGLTFLTFPFVVYFVKFGVAWHDAGKPFDLTDVKFDSYWNMIIILYFTLGIYLIAASFNPTRFAPLLSWHMWGAQFGHGCVALVCVFADKGPSSAYTEKLGLPNWDKLFVAVPIWFSLFTINLFFAKKCFNSYLLPICPHAFDFVDGKSSCKLKCATKGTQGEIEEPVKPVKEVVEFTGTEEAV